ncbi:MurR/RpiR family transcriptional regulator [Paenibacillus sp. Sa2BVA9]|uniref:MurR/RpiR family transcriptional regulator n=2 Tax=Paenibacillus gallinarum TaxID=2762232 RepID=A0ABR8T6V4_9BACL|nr:MurR/RpiR family transcriptional regulator [Paenibacillus gallinarum]
MSSSMIDKLQIEYQRFSAKEKEIADYVMRNQASIMNINIRDLAANTYTSTSTITRFCRKVGCATFVDFKILLNREVQQPRPETRFFPKTQQAYNDIINATAEMLDTEQIEQVVTLIKKSRRIYVYGLGSSGLSALEFKYRLTRMNIIIDAVTDSHMMIMSASLLGQDDLVIGISNSGRTIEVSDALDAAKKRGAKVVGITNFDHTPLSEISDICLFTPDIDRTGDVHFINSQLAIIYILDVISLLLLEDGSLFEARQNTLKALYHRE